MYKRTLIIIMASILGLLSACSEDGQDSQNNTPGGSATLCQDACVKIAPCAGITSAACESKCGLLTSAQLQCAADSGSCQAADQCVAATSNNNTPDMDSTPKDMGNNTNPDPCSKCDKSGFEACVRQGSSYSCKKTVQSCNGKFYPDVCNCLYDGIGQSAEGRALCSAGVSSCGFDNDRVLDVGCK